MVAIGHKASSQPLAAYNKLLALEPSTLSMELHRACTVKRTHANKVKLRLNTGATGHDEGNEIVIRSLTLLHTGTQFE